MFAWSGIGKSLRNATSLLVYRANPWVSGVSGHTCAVSQRTWTSMLAGLGGASDATDQLQSVQLVQIDKYAQAR